MFFKRKAAKRASNRTSSRRAFAARPRLGSLSLEPLEQRALLTTFAYNFAAVSDVTLRVSGGNYQIVDSANPGTVLASQSTGSTTAISITGTASYDTLTILSSALHTNVPISFAAGGGSPDRLYLDDTAHTSFTDYIVTDSTISVDGKAITYSGVETLELLASNSRFNNIEIESTNVNTQTLIIGSDQDNLMKLGATSQTLDNIDGSLILLGGWMVFDDSASTDEHLYNFTITSSPSPTLDAGLFARDGMATIAFQVFEIGNGNTVELLAGTSPDSEVWVQGTIALSTTTIVKAGHKDQLVYAGVGQLDNLAGTLSVHGGTIKIADQWSPGSHDYLFSSEYLNPDSSWASLTRVPRDEFGLWARINWGGPSIFVDSVEFTMGNDDSSVFVEGTMDSGLGTPFTINMGNGMQEVTIGDDGFLGNDPGDMDDIADDDVYGPAITVNGGVLILDDRAGASAATYTVTDTSVARTAAGRTSTIAYNDITSIALQTGTHADNVTNIRSTSSAGLYVGAGGAGQDFNIGDSGTLDNLDGGIFVDTDGGNISMDDSANSTSSLTYSFTSGSMTRTGLPTIFWFDSESVRLYGGSGTKTVNISAASSLWYINNGTGATTVNIGAVGGTAASISGNLNVYGSSAGDTFNLNATGSGNVSLQAYEEDRHDPDNIFNVERTTTGTTTLDGGEGSDTFLIGAVDQDLANIGTVNVNGKGNPGTDVLTVDDSLGAHGTLSTGNPITQSGSSVSVTYAGIETVNRISG